ncbi:MAG: hypothetical protein ACFHVJ_06420 [Aestuariibacter sp.]
MFIQFNILAVLLSPVVAYCVGAGVLLAFDSHKNAQIELDTKQ